jgi:hypothetical protein
MRLTSQLSVFKKAQAKQQPVCRVASANLDQGHFTEGHELDRKTEKRVPKAIGRRLSQEEAKRSLAKLDEGPSGTVA